MCRFDIIAIFHGQVPVREALSMGTEIDVLKILRFVIIVPGVYLHGQPSCYAVSQGDTREIIAGIGKLNVSIRFMILLEVCIGIAVPVIGDHPEVIFSQYANIYRSAHRTAC